MKQKPMQETKLQETKILKPAVVFRKTTAPSKQDILDSRNDPDYQPVFARTKPNDEMNNFTLETTMAELFPDNVLAKCLTIGSNPNYRNLVESKADKQCADSIRSMQNVAIRSAADKYRIAVEQNVNYCISDAVGCLTTVLDSRDESANASSALTEAFSFSSNSDTTMSVRINNNAFFTMHFYDFSLYEYIEMIGKSMNDSSNKSFDDACFLVFNKIVMITFSCISAYTSDASAIVNQIVYSRNSGLTLDDASSCINVFNTIFDKALSDISDAIQQNAYALLNDIILIAQTLYGDAEFTNYTNSNDFMTIEF